MSNIDHISKQLEADRQRLAQSLDALTDTLKPQSLAKDAASAANTLGNDLAQKAWGSLKKNPAGGLLVTIGLGLLATGSQRQPMSPPKTSTVASPPTAAPPNEAFIGFDERVAKADAEMRAEQFAPATEASKLRAALNSGLDKLPPKARNKVLKARKAAISAQEKIERQSRRAARQTKGFVNEQPLAAGAIALGFGVLAGTLLPGTRREDLLLGKRRDALMSTARKVLEEELLKAHSKAETVFSEKTGANVKTFRH